ncbi:MAG: calcium/sodium antiporter [Phycisphaerales bacterium]|nr:calcium/sodium antiporter [Phycisphaerae bacterium]NNF43200.1 calcium/sodium antiporter [Phycisphaerales bacterium]NNM26853.1 calcium/sodium antiporter [Phycisphaerales bacterium]
MSKMVLDLLAAVPAPVTFVIGVVALLAGGRWLVEGAVKIALDLGISTLLIGLTVVAFGTSAPELFFNVTAAVSGQGELSFGNVVGSNIANITLVLGLSSLLAPLVVMSRVIKKELPQLIAVTAGMLFLAWLPGRDAATFGRVDGLIMLACFATFAWLWIRLGRRDRKDPLAAEAETDVGSGPSSTTLAIVFLILGLAMLLGGAKCTEVGAVGIAEMLEIPSSVVGLTIVALATSLPEVVTSVIAARRGHGDLAVGNVVGSNLFNILLVLGATSVVADVPVPQPWGWWDLGVMLGVTLLLLPMAMTNQRRITRPEGIVLVACYAGYMIFTVVR